MESGPADDRLKRAQGCLIGLLAGDALGSAVEFCSASYIAQHHPDGVREMTDGGTYDTLAGQPTDDGELALALARSLIGRSRFDEEKIARAYVRWLSSEPFDQGGTISQALAAGVRAMGTDAAVAEACRMRASTTSQANGALMRIAPLGIFGAGEPQDDLVRWARVDAQLTHAHPACMDANAAYVVAIAAAIADGADGEGAYGAACAWAESAQAEATVRETLTKAKTELPEGFDGPKSGWVLIALQNAFYRLLHTDSFEQALVDTVACGGDTDTTAAICGGLLGAVRGLEAIPAQWKAAVLTCRPKAGEPRAKRPRPVEYWPVDGLELAEKLLAAGKVDKLEDEDAG
ncbi:MAG: ADP-ribosylglycohydrolase family protein [Deltaproteobacteria bacterium]|nr:ADP-ribosylglycohydrolase family protein [Deltaproteobacteria bacterium]